MSISTFLHWLVEGELYHAGSTITSLDIVVGGVLARPPRPVCECVPHDAAPPPGTPRLLHLQRLWGLAVIWLLSNRNLKKEN